MDKLIANYIKYLEEIKHLNPKTIKVYKFQIRNMIEYNNYKNIVDLQNSNIIQLNKWVNSKNEMSNQYQNQMIASAKSFFGYLMAYRLISYNPSKELKALKIETKGVVGNTGQIEEIKEYLKKEYESKPNFMNLRNMLMVEILLQTALRNSELRQLNIDSINKDGCFTVIQKGGSKKDCVLNSKGMKLYNKYIVERKKIKAKDDALFISSYKTRISSKGLEKVIEKISMATGQKLKVHSMRHASLTAYVNAGFSLTEVARLAGHSNTQTTFKFYYHQSTDNKKKMAEDVWG